MKKIILISISFIIILTGCDGNSQKNIETINKICIENGGSIDLTYTVNKFTDSISITCKDAKKYDLGNFKIR